MISIDTNILVRLLTGDDPKQAATAKHLFEKEHIYITRTVVLETEWVLRFAYKFNVNVIADAFIKLLGQQKVTVEDTHHVAKAVNMLNNGMDFADALHLTCSQRHPFATFDRKLKAKADAAGMAEVRLL